MTTPTNTKHRKIHNKIALRYLFLVIIFYFFHHQDRGTDSFRHIRDFTKEGKRGKSRDWDE
jgi:hypothetical protein